MPSRKYCAGGIRLRYCRAAIFASVFGQCSRRIPGFPMPQAVAQDPVEHRCPIGTTDYSGQRCRPASRWRASGRIGAGWGQSRGWSGSESSDFALVAVFIERVWVSRGIQGRAAGRRTRSDIQCTWKWGQVGGRRVTAAFLIRRLGGPAVATGQGEVRQGMLVSWPAWGCRKVQPSNRKRAAAIASLDGRAVGITIVADHCYRLALRPASGGV